MDYLEHQECIARENFLIPSAIPHSEDVVAVEIRRKEVWFSNPFHQIIFSVFIILFGTILLSLFLYMVKEIILF